MKGQFGVWIDHEKALIVAAGQDTVTVMPSHMRGHPRFSGGGGYPGGDSSQGGGSEKRTEEHHRNELTKYFDEVATVVGGAETVLIFGPGEARHELAHCLEHMTARPRPTIVLEPSDKLTEAQVVAKVTNYFDAHPRSNARPH
ncbi:MAG: hypothetical protein ABI665_28125 [Vicinamibacterales bacterium]